MLKNGYIFESIIKNKKNVLGFLINDISLNELISSIEFALVNKIKLNITFVNPNSFFIANKQKYLFKYVNSFDIVCADGIGVIFASKLLFGNKLKERLSANIIAPHIYKLLIKYNKKIFLLGSKEYQVRLAKINILNSYPLLNIAGVHHGYFSDNNKIVNLVNRTKADVIFIGLGSPYQEEWILKNDSILSSNIRITCGGYIHQTASRVEYYPEWVNKFYLNWLYRFVNEPKRTWRRYLIGIPFFLFILLREVLKNKENNNLLI